MRLSVAALDGWTRGLLEAAGLPEAQAAAAARVFTAASLRGVGHHDISFLPQRLDWLANHGVNPRPEIRLVRAFGATEVWDGDHGLGEVCCSHATDRAMILANEYGIGYAAVRNTNHFLAASPYVERCASMGFLGLVFSNTDAGMALPGETRLGIGNNPMGFAVPGASPESPGLMGDLCMAYSSLGNLRALADAGQRVPSWWGTDRDGRPTDDPAAILGGGACQPMGGHKGFALALLVETLTGILADGPTGDRIASGGGVNTHNQAVLAINLGAFGGSEEVGARVDDLATRLKTAHPGLRLPGERSRNAESAARTTGVELPQPLAASLTTWSQRLGITPPMEAS